MDKQQVTHSLRIAYGDNPVVPKRERPSKTLGEALDRIECEARELSNLLGKSNSATLDDFLRALK